MSPRMRAARGLAALRALRHPNPETAESCQLCSAPLRENHDHLIDRQTRHLICACQACAILFDSDAEMKYRRVPKDVWDLGRSGLSDRAWASLAIPIGLAFLCRAGTSGVAMAVYPSPAGPAETELDAATWDDLLSENPALARLTPDVEALLINRLNGAREYFIAPIDECYKLTGIVRRYWRGLSGGEQAWEQIGKFLDALKSRCSPAARTHAEPVV